MRLYAVSIDRAFGWRATTSGCNSAVKRNTTNMVTTLMSILLRKLDDGNMKMKSFELMELRI